MIRALIVTTLVLVVIYFFKSLSESAGKDVGKKVIGYFSSRISNTAQKKKKPGAHLISDHHAPPEKAKAETFKITFCNETNSSNGHLENIITIHSNSSELSVIMNGSTCPQKCQKWKHAQ